MAFAFPSLISNNGLVFLKILYAVSSIIFTYSSINIVQFFAGKKLDFLQQFVFLTAFFCLYKPIFNSAVLWLTGAFNFFLPFAFVLCVVAIMVVSRIFRTFCSSQSVKHGFVSSREDSDFKPISLGSCSYTFACPTFAQPYSVGEPPPTSGRRDHPGSCPPPWFDGEFRGSNAQADCSS